MASKTNNFPKRFDVRFTEQNYEKVRELAFSHSISINKILNALLNVATDDNVKNALITGGYK